MDKLDQILVSTIKNTYWDVSTDPNEKNQYGNFVNLYKMTNNQLKPLNKNEIDEMESVISYGPVVINIWYSYINGLNRYDLANGIISPYATPIAFLRAVYHIYHDPLDRQTIEKSIFKVINTINQLAIDPDELGIDINHIISKYEQNLDVRLVDFLGKQRILYAVTNTDTGLYLRLREPKDNESIIYDSLRNLLADLK